MMTFIIVLFFWLLLGFVANVFGNIIMGDDLNAGYGPIALFVYLLGPVLAPLFVVGVFIQKLLPFASKLSDKIRNGI